MVNSVILVGRLTGDPALRKTQQGTSVAGFCVAVDRRTSGGERVADFINCTAWAASAEFLAKYFRKGSPIAVCGSIQTRKYQDKNGNSRTAVEVVASQISFVPAPAGTRQGGASAAAPNVMDEGYDQMAMPGAGQSRHAAAGYTYAQGSAEDFALIEESEDLPF